MTIPVSDEGGNPTGHAWLRRELNLAVPPPAVESYVAAGARRTEVRGRRVVEQYSRQYATEDSVVAHLRFALRHEPIDLGVLVATFKAIEAADLEAWVRAEPTGAFSRRHDRVADTVRRDLTEELAFIAVFDRACAAVREIVDMPDRRMALFVRLCMQGGGRLSAKKRRLFAELEDVEVDAMQASIGDALADATSGP